jgi:hypothetical protein
VSSDEVTPQLWTVWGVRLLALITIATSISLGYMWVEEFYRGVAVNSSISFMATDLPGMPPHIAAAPVIGVHYFGDFQLPYAWALDVRGSTSPYLLSASSPISNYDPFVIVFLIPFTVMSIKAATLVYLVLEIVIYIVPLWLLLSPLRPSFRCVILAPVAFVTTPLIAVLDRGNTIGVAFALTFWALVAWRSQRWVWCGVCVALAIALKEYPVGLLVVPLALRRYKFAVLVGGAAIAANLAALLAIPGGYVKNLRALIPLLSNHTLVAGSQITFWGLYSVIPKFVGLVFGPTDGNRLLNPDQVMSWVPTVIYLVLLFIVIWRERVPQWCWGPLSLATIQLIGTVGGTYTTGWASAAAIWFGWGVLVPAPRSSGEHTQRLDDDIVLRIFTLLAIAATLVPSVATFTGVGGFGVPVTDFLSPVLLFVTLCIATVKSFWFSGIERRTEAGESVGAAVVIPEPSVVEAEC